MINSHLSELKVLKFIQGGDQINGRRPQVNNNQRAFHNSGNQNYRAIGNGQNRDNLNVRGKSYLLIITDIIFNFLYYLHSVRVLSCVFVVVAS